MKSHEELRSLHVELVDLLKDRPHGPYKAVARIFGKPMADRLARDPTSGLVQCGSDPEAPLAGPSKRKAADYDDSDDDDAYSRPARSRVRT